MIYINKKILNKKIEYILCDFDRTITIHNSNTCWNFISNSKFVDKKLKEECDLTYKLYRPIELSTSISFIEKSKYMMQWPLDVIKIYDKYGINKDMFNYLLRKENGIILRDDFKEFLYKTNKYNIKFYIVSAGIYDVIYYILDKNNLLLNNVSIISNKFIFSDKGLEGIDGDIIHSCNKDIIKLDINTNDYGLLIGDQIDDRVLGKNYNTCDIGFCEEIDLLNEYNKSFDITLTGGSSFKNISKLLIKK